MMAAHDGSAAYLTYISHVLPFMFGRFMRRRHPVVRPFIFRDKVKGERR